MSCIKVSNKREYNQLKELIGELEAKKLVIANEGLVPPLDHEVVQEIVEKQNVNKLKNTSNETAETKLESKMKDFLKSISVDVKAVDKIRDENGKELSVIAKADLAHKTIEYIEGKRDETTLPEEAATFFLAYLPKDHPLYKAMFSNIVNFKVYEDTKRDYPDFTEEEQRYEAITKLVAQRLQNFKQTNETKETQSRVKRWWERVVSYIKSLLGGITSKDSQNLIDEYNEVAGLIYNNQTKILDTSISPEGRTIFFQRKNTGLTQAALLEKLFKLQERILSPRYKDENDNRYPEVTPKGERLVKNRVSDGLKKNIKTPDTLRNKILLKLGRDLHGVLDDITRKFKPGEKVKNTYSWLNNKHFDVLHDTIEAIHKESTEIQNQIDPKGKFVMVPEIRIYDEKTDTAGTIDLLVSFSDGSISRYEYKFINFTTDESKTVVIQDNVPWYKQDMYDAQMLAYETIIRSNIGNQQERLTRAIPFNLQIEYLQGKPTKVIKNIESFTSGKDYTEPLPSPTELTEDKKLNSLISSLRTLYENSRLDIQRNFKDQDARRKAEVTKKAIQDLLVKKEARTILKNVHEFAKKVQQKVEIGDASHPDYANYDELRSLKNELLVYRDLETALQSTVEQIEDAEERAKIEKNRKEINLVVALALEAVTNKELSMIVKEGEKHGIKGLDTPNKQLGLVEANAMYGSQIDHPYFRLLNRKTNEMYDKERAEKNKFFKTAEEVTNNLKDWANQNGMSVKDAYDKLINYDTKSELKNLITPFKKEFWERVKKAKEDKDIKWMKAHFKLRTDWKKDFEKSKKEFFDYVDTFYPKGDEKLKQHKKDEWIELNDLESSDEAWFYKFAKLDIINPDQHYSDRWKYVLANKPLHDFYNWHVEHMLIYSEYVNAKEHKNFIPNVRKDLVQAVLEQGPGAIWDSVSNLDRLRTRDVGDNGLPSYRDPVTQELIFAPPIMFLDKIEASDKSYDLASNMMAFAEMAIHYKYANEIKGMAYTMQDLLAVENKQQYELELKNKYGYVQRIIKGNSNAEKAFKTQVNYHLFKQHTQDINEAKGELSKTKILHTAMSAHRMLNLPLGWVSATASHLGATFNNYFEATKSKNFTPKQFKEAGEMLVTNHRLSKLLYDFFELDPSMGNVRTNKLRMDASKHINSENVYFMWRKPEHLIEMHHLIAMMKNHTIENGKIIKLQHHSKVVDKITQLRQEINDDAKFDEAKEELYKTHELKSLLDLTKETEKNIAVNGLTQEMFNDFRRKVVESISTTKGVMHGEDIMNIKTNLVFQLLGQYKLSWLPKMLMERFQAPKYLDVLDEVKIGRYKVVAGELGISYKEAADRLSAARQHRDVLMGEYVLEFAKATVPMMQNAGKMFGEAVSLGLLQKMGFAWNRPNPKLTEIYFEKWLNEHPELFDTRTEDPVTLRARLKQQFIEEREAQFRAAIGELRVALYLSLLAFLLLADFDDDDKKNYKEIPGFQQVYKVIERTQNELKFFYSPFDYMKLWSNPIPVFGLVGDVTKAITNSGDVMLDIIFGNERMLFQGNKIDRSGPGKYFLNATGLDNITKFAGVDPSQDLQEYIEELHGEE